MSTNALELNVGFKPDIQFQQPGARGVEFAEHAEFVTDGVVVQQFVHTEGAEHRVPFSDQRRAAAAAALAMRAHEAAEALQVLVPEIYPRHRTRIPQHVHAGLEVRMLDEGQEHRLRAREIQRLVEPDVHVGRFAREAGGHRRRLPRPE
ncbi:MAG: hypothetical protein K2Y51_21125 [Gammaproteobacteria bacterium]|nr:hypothetical protein [Gammaproteobacteria bacterium]